MKQRELFKHILQSQSKMKSLIIFTLHISLIIKISNSGFQIFSLIIERIAAIKSSFEAINKNDTFDTLEQNVLYYFITIKTLPRKVSRGVLWNSCSGNKIANMTCCAVITIRCELTFSSFTHCDGKCIIVSSIWLVYSISSYSLLLVITVHISFSALLITV